MTSGIPKLFRIDTARSLLLRSAPRPSSDRRKKSSIHDPTRSAADTLALAAGLLRLALSCSRSMISPVFRPCIDLHAGTVKQLVGGTLNDVGRELATNFVSEKSSAEFAELYRQDELRGGHVILLGPGNEAAARAALAAYPSGMQVGGGINLNNAASWLDAGACQVIVTSWLFQGGRVDFERLASLQRKIGKQRLVLDLSCRRRGADYWIVTDRWQTFTDVSISAQTLGLLAGACQEFLVHAVDVEGLAPSRPSPSPTLAAQAHCRTSSSSRSSAKDASISRSARRSTFLAEPACAMPTLWRSTAAIAWPQRSEPGPGLVHASRAAHSERVEHRSEEAGYDGPSSACKQ